MISLSARHRRRALEALSRRSLAELTETFELDVADRRVRNDHVTALIRSRRIDFEDMLGVLKRRELKLICEVLGLSTKGREKALLIGRILELDEPDSTPRLEPVERAQMSAPSKASRGVESKTTARKLENSEKRLEPPRQSVTRAFADIQIVNLHYDDTVETDVYRALRDRIGLFSQFVGKLQPILSQLPKSIGDTALKAPRPERDRMKAELVSKIDDDVRAAQQGGFDIDAITDSDLEAPPRPTAAYDLKDLDRLIKIPELLPPGMEIKRLGKREYSLAMPGMSEPLRVTTDPEFFEEHPESAELWAPGSPLFPDVETAAEPEELATAPTLAVVVETARATARSKG